jgi:hypothetical protein
MFCDVKLTGKEFQTIHNALWGLSSLNNTEVNQQVELIHQALQGAYQQERENTERRYDHYNSVKKELGLTTTWSMTEVENLSERHPFEGVKYITYKNFWGEGVVTKAINGSTWAALYVAADACICDSGDHHHVFIEGFKQSGETLNLCTGS